MSNEDITKDMLVDHDDGILQKSPPLDYIEEEFHLTKTTEALQDQLALSRYTMNTGNLVNSGTGENEIVFPPSHNVFDANHLQEMVEVKGYDIEISNYISKMSGDDGTTVLNLQSQTQSRDLSEPTYHAVEATDQNPA